MLFLDTHDTAEPFRYADAPCKLLSCVADLDHIMSSTR